MKARNLLKLFCQFREDGDFQVAQEVAERLELDLNRWVGLMSTGMRQKLALAICLSNRAPLLILDEPTANLDPTVRGQVVEIIREAKSFGRTVIFSRTCCQKSRTRVIELGFFETENLFILNRWLL